MTYALHCGCPVAAAQRLLQLHLHGGWVLLLRVPILQHLVPVRWFEEGTGDVGDDIVGASTALSVS